MVSVTGILFHDFSWLFLLLGEVETATELLQERLHCADFIDVRVISNFIK